MANDSAGGAGDWPTIKWAWTETNLAKKYFLDEFGIPESWIQRRAIAEGWPERPARGKGVAYVRPSAAAEAAAEAAVEAAAEGSEKPKAGPTGSADKAKPARKTSPIKRGVSQSATKGTSKANARGTRSVAAKTGVAKAASARASRSDPSQGEAEAGLAMPDEDTTDIVPASDAIAQFEALLAKLVDEPDQETADKLRRTLVAQAYLVISLKFDQIARRMKSGKRVPMEESERLTKEITAVVTALEKSHDLAPGASRGGNGAKPGGGFSALSSPADVERARREIAERLERIQQKRDAEQRSGDLAGGDA